MNVQQALALFLSVLCSMPFQLSAAQQAEIKQDAAQAQAPLSQALQQKRALSAAQLQDAGVTSAEIFEGLRSEELFPNHHVDNRALQGLLPLMLSNNVVSKKILFTQRMEFKKAENEQWIHLFNDDRTRCVSWKVLGRPVEMTAYSLHEIETARELVIWNPETGELFKYVIAQNSKITDMRWEESCLCFSCNTGVVEILDCANMGNVYKRGINQLQIQRMISLERGNHGESIVRLRDQSAVLLDAMLEGIKGNEPVELYEGESKPRFAAGLDFDDDFDDSIESAQSKYFFTPQGSQCIIEREERSGSIFFRERKNKRIFYSLEHIQNFKVEAYNSATIVFGYANSAYTIFTIEFWDIENYSCIKKIEIAGNVRSWNLLHKGVRQFGENVRFFCRDTYRGPGIYYGSQIKPKYVLKEDLHNITLWGLSLVFDDKLEYWDVIRNECDESIPFSPDLQGGQFFEIVPCYLGVWKQTVPRVQILAADTLKCANEIRHPFPIDQVVVGRERDEIIIIDEYGCTTYFLPHAVMKHLAKMRPEQVSLILDVADALDQGIPIAWSFLNQEQQKLLSGDQHPFITSVRNSLKKNARAVRKKVVDAERRSMIAADGGRVAAVQREHQEGQAQNAFVLDELHPLPLRPVPWHHSPFNWMKRQSRRWPVRLLLAAAFGVGTYYGWRKWGRNWFKRVAVG